ncbi:UPF0547 protein C16orf87 homolog isoform X2 [Cyanistes caeruleus]|uniref:UPF0547 protein C16orf87 homolog isoform X2 n=1 Tax=Cyanistes caeruleus TaxID=156563 RepID=UPI000CDA6DA3|nr:UPF0547 protein C16orf87 homolog isoform X2 [Cyanistes caeruleus]
MFSRGAVRKQRNRDLWCNLCPKCPRELFVSRCGFLACAKWSYSHRAAAASHRCRVRSSSPFTGNDVPVACKSCPCGYIFISRKLLHAKRAERSPPITENKSEAKRRRTERVKREKINSAVNKDLENRKRSRSNSHSDHSRRGRGRPKSASAKKHEEERVNEKLQIQDLLLCIIKLVLPRAVACHRYQ